MGIKATWEQKNLLQIYPLKRAEALTHKIAFTLPYKVPCFAFDELIKIRLELGGCSDISYDCRPSFSGYEIYILKRPIRGREWFIHRFEVLGFCFNVWVGKPKNELEYKALYKDFLKIEAIAEHFLKADELAPLVGEHRKRVLTKIKEARALRELGRDDY